MLAIHPRQTFRLLPTLLLPLLLLRTSDLAVRADVTVPHSPGNRVVAENLHATDQAFVEVHDIMDSLTDTYYGLRERSEAATLRAVRAFDPRRDNAYALVERVRRLSEQLVAELEQHVERQHADMDELIQIAVELHETNLNLSVDDPEQQQAMQLLQGLRNTKYGQVGAMLRDLRDRTAEVRERKLLEALRVAAQLRRRGGGVAEAVRRIERVIFELLDEQRAIVLVNRARSQAVMSALEHQFRTASLELTLAEQRAHAQAQAEYVG